MNSNYLPVAVRRRYTGCLIGLSFLYIFAYNGALVLNLHAVIAAER